MKLHKVHILHIFNHACNGHLVVLLHLTDELFLGISKKLLSKKSERDFLQASEKNILGSKS